MMKTESMTIAVIGGGLSPEAEISRRSRAAVAAGLRRQGYTVTEVEATPDGLRAMLDARPEIAWIAAHGPLGEDGTLQGFLEMMRIPYTGTGVAASAVAMDKALTRRLLRGTSVRQPRWTTVGLGEVDWFSLPDDWSFPVIVKPVQGGSSVATAVANSADELIDAIYEVLRVDDRAIVETFLTGRELSVGVFEGEVLGDIEIETDRPFYDYSAKYESGHTRYILTPELADGVRGELHRQALEVWQAVGCEGIVRIDFFLVGDQDLRFIEVNTTPGLTEHSLLPKMAAAAGLRFDELVERIALQARLKCVI
ncbi:MAG: D-alanine--D-alanine ligase [Candidatus Dadabacteria bacterium]|nr:MAG: D-alanine--D-alanine ligase [Candidatus Dadabacteria bacterium]